MATVFKKTFTKPLPDGAEVLTRKGERFARWKDGKGKTRTAKVAVPEKGRHAGTPRIIMEAGTYTAKYRDGQGIVQIVKTGCRDKRAAQAVLSRLVSRAENVRSGLMTADQDRAADHHQVPIADHVAAYLEHLRAKTVRGRRVSTAHRANVEQNLNRVIAECCISRLADITRTVLETWMNRIESEGMGARTRNTHRAAIVAFCNWCVETGRFPANPLARLCKADERSDRRRCRRALTEDELRRLLRAARLRPLAEHGRETIRRPPTERKGRRTWTKAPLTPKNIGAANARGLEVLREKPGLIAELEHIGRERALAYKTLMLTGLRKGELASLTVGQVKLDGPRPHLDLLAKDEKAGRGAVIPLRPDLAADLRSWLNERLAAIQTESRANGDAIPARLPTTAPLLSMPSDAIRAFNRDLEAAGIPKSDDQKRTVDLHALRHTFATHLSKRGVAPRTAQAALRHSTLDLTMNVYTDPRLLDVAGALDVLPALPLDGEQTVQYRATGTCDGRPLAPTLAPVLAPDGDKRRKSLSSADKTVSRVQNAACAQVITDGQERRPRSFADNGRHKAGEGTRTLNNQLGRLKL